MRSPRNIHDGYCRSGDRCDRKAENAGRFCAHHQAELDRVKAMLGESADVDRERRERRTETRRLSSAKPAVREKRRAYVNERDVAKEPQVHGGPLLPSAPFASWLSRTVRGVTEFETAQLTGMTTRNLRRLRNGQQHFIRRGTVERALTRWGRPDLFESLYPNA